MHATTHAKDTTRRAPGARLRTAARAVFVVAMMGGALAIGRASLPYFVGDELHEFLLEKLPVAHEDIFLVALHAHVASALFGLVGCAVLLSRTILRRTPWLHRHLGRATALVVLVVAVPSGLWLSAFAKGGLVVTVGFVLSALVVAVALVHGVLTARRRDFAAHRRAMLHVMAQLSVAVTSRALLVGLDALAVDPETAYVAALWLPVVSSALVVELIAPRPALARALSSSRASPVERSSHEDRAAPRRRLSLAR